MINMIRADLYRIFRNIGIYIAFAILLLMLAISIYTVSPGNLGTASVTVNDVTISNEFPSSMLEDLSLEDLHGMRIQDLRKLMLKSEGYELDRDILSVNINLYYLFIFIAALAVTVDFSTGSVKNTLSSAISRKTYFISKTLLVIILCLLLFFLNTYLAYFGNLIFNSKNLASSLWTVTKISLMQLPPILALASILSGLAFIVKKTSIFNTISIPLIMAAQLIFQLILQVFNIKGDFMQYEFQIMIKMLANNPSRDYLIRSYLVCAVVIILAHALGYISFHKTEVK